MKCAFAFTINVVATRRSFNVNRKRKFLEPLQQDEYAIHVEYGEIPLYGRAMMMMYEGTRK